LLDDSGVAVCIGRLLWAQFFDGGSFALNDVLTMHLVNARQRGGCRA
jgi:hypothetical protein